VPLVLSKKGLKRILAPAPSLEGARDCCRWLMAFAGCVRRGRGAQVGDILIANQEDHPHSCNRRGARNRNSFAACRYSEPAARLVERNGRPGQDMMFLHPSGLFPAIGQNTLSATDIAAIQRDRAGTGITKTGHAAPLEGTFANPFCWSAAWISASFRPFWAIVNLTPQHAYASVATGMIAHGQPLDDSEWTSPSKGTPHPS